MNFNVKVGEHVTLKINDMIKSKTLGDGLYEIIGESGQNFLIKPVGQPRKKAFHIAKSACDAATPAERCARFKTKKKEHA